MSDLIYIIFIRCFTEWLEVVQKCHSTILLDIFYSEAAYSLCFNMKSRSDKKGWEQDISVS